MQNYIYNSCGDHHVKTSGNKHVDPPLKLYAECPLMVNNNTNLMTDGCGNGTLCRLKGIRLREGKIHSIKMSVVTSLMLYQLEMWNTSYVSIGKVKMKSHHQHFMLKYYLILQQFRPISMGQDF